MAHGRRILSHKEYDKTTIFVPGRGQLGGQEVVKLQGEVFEDIAGQAEKIVQGRRPRGRSRGTLRHPRKVQNLPPILMGLLHRPHDRTVLRRVVRQDRPSA
jgi:hypothetical protein